MNKLKMYLSVLAERAFDPFALCCAFIGLEIAAKLINGEASMATSGDVFLAAALIILAVRGE